MTTTDHQVLTDLGTLAAREHWARTEEFLHLLGGDADGTVVLAAGDAAAPLLGWLAGQDAGPVVARPLTVAETDPGRLLAAGRVIVALRAGQLLEVEQAEAVTAVLERPEPTRRIVLIGPPADAAGWTTAERSVWRVLLGGQEDWREQDLGPRGCLRWAPPAGTGDDRVARDREALLAWLTGPAADPELARMRAVHALDLAESDRDRERPAGDQAGDDRLRSRISRSRRRMDGHLEALAASARREVAATLETLDADLTAGATHEVRAATAGRSDPRLAASVVAAYLDRRMRDWVSGPYHAVGDRVFEALQITADDLDELELPDAFHARRSTLTAGLRRPPRFPVPVPRATALVPATAGDPPIPLLTLAGAVVGGAVGFVLPMPAGTVAGAALGALGGRAVQQQRTGAATQEWIDRFVPGAVATALKPLRENAEERLTTVVAARRAEIDRLLGDAEQALRTPDRPESASSADPRSTLAALRRSLA